MDRESIKREIAENVELFADKVCEWRDKEIAILEQENDRLLAEIAVENLLNNFVKTLDSTEKL